MIKYKARVSQQELEREAGGEEEDRKNIYCMPPKREVEVRAKENFHV